MILWCADLAPGERANREIVIEPCPRPSYAPPQSVDGRNIVDDESTGFPTGLVARPAHDDELGVVTGMLRAAEQLDRGRADLTIDDIASMWRTPGFDLERHTCTVWDGDSLVAYADFDRRDRAEAAVHPAHRGRGIGAALVAWTERACLTDRPIDVEARVGQTIVDTHRDAVHLLTSLGYEPRHTSWVLELPVPVDLGDRLPPAGYRLRPFEPGRDDDTVFQVIEDAFNEWPTRLPSSPEAWRAMTLDRDDFDPSLLVVAEHDGEVIGASVGYLVDGERGREGWVDQLAVRRDHRGRGLGAALLAASFGDMRDRGAVEVGLSTDSRTGALDLYTSLGMVVTMSFTRYSKVLRPPG